MGNFIPTLTPCVLMPLCSDSLVGGNFASKIRSERIERGRHTIFQYGFDDFGGSSQNINDLLDLLRLAPVVRSREGEVTIEGYAMLHPAGRDPAPGGNVGHTARRVLSR